MKSDAPQVKRSDKKVSRAQQSRPAPQKVKPKEKQNPDGDLQAKLAMLKGKFGQ